MHPAAEPGPRRARPARRTRPPHAFNVVRNPSRELLDARIDWSEWYLDEEAEMGDSLENDGVRNLFRSVLEMLASERGWSQVVIAEDVYFAWYEADPNVRVTPDVFLLDGPVPVPLPKRFETWRPGHRPPRFALEVVSELKPAKDYVYAPEKYAQLGTAELVIFDPTAAARPTSGRSRRVALQVYRRLPDGSFLRVYHGAGPAWSAELDAWLVVTPGPVLRIARDAAGTSLVPSALEAAAEAERRAAEAGRSAGEAGRRAEEAGRRAEVESARAEQALAEVARLRKLLDGRGGTDGTP